MGRGVGLSNPIPLRTNSVLTSGVPRSRRGLPGMGSGALILVTCRDGAAYEMPCRVAKVRAETEGGIGKKRKNEAGKGRSYALYPGAFVVQQVRSTEAGKRKHSEPSYLCCLRQPEWRLCAGGRWLCLGRPCIYEKKKRLGDDASWPSQACLSERRQEFTKPARTESEQSRGFQG